MPWVDGKYCLAVDEACGLYRGLRPLIRNAKDGGVLSLVPAGAFEMGDGAEACSPKHRVYLDTFYIGVTCVTNRQYGRFVGETGRLPSEGADWGSPIWRDGRCPEEVLDHPAVCVSWDDAAAYAKWVGCLLPTEAQWEKSARGPEGYLFPWGNAWDADKCRNSWNRDSGTTCAVWSYPTGTSGYGTLNQSGNVMEWCRDWCGENFYSENGAGLNPAGPVSGSARICRSGSWNGGNVDNFMNTVRSWNSPSHRDQRLGFRLIRETEERRAL